MGIVRTIHGDVDPSTLGVVNAHDHLIRVGAGEVYIDPDHLLVDEDKAAQEAAYFVEASKRFAPTATIVDMCPASSGRGVVKLKRVVDRVPDLQVVAATGFHQQKVYLEWRQSWANQYTVTEIADLLIADVVEGIDAGDYMGPLVKRTDVRAGVEAGLRTHLVLSGSTAREDVCNYPFRPFGIHEGIGDLIELVEAAH